MQLDLGAGKGTNSPDGFVKVDIKPAKGVKVVDLCKPWPWKANSVDQARAIYLIHFFTPKERIHFANELYRVLKVGGQCEVHTPHWAASKAYGDLATQYPPVAEWWYPFLNSQWRQSQNYEITGYKCNFDVGIGYGMHQELLSRNQDYQQNALRFYKEAAQDLIVTLTKL